ncbi:hypothetical protein GCM10017576_26100 [Microbacterium barkeri]|uniref:Uncharacterized protein n=1 Tax=Microbacterium barkeri TaxID=33917 RepID=A0A9W6H5K3_9MICO|nr:hypothetical protein [Microbacterium barkeri]MDR6877543.1 uncharacterized protein (DUF934 family) [Microbacterium barkeri]GLJ62480.1 hypothetical protein GCM10017576_26100 [Microbacterium barkeri]
MQPLLDFLGDYWWLVFPFMGVASGFGGWWSKQSKERHKRRLELIKAKSEARAVEMQARAQLKASKAQDGPAEDIEADDAASRQARLARLMATHDEVMHRWLDYELDVAKLIAFPTMSDGRQPLTAAFLRAKKVADGLRPASADVKIDAATLAEYRDAVHDFEVAFDIAEQDARRVRDSGFTEDERRRLDRAQQLLRTAVDQSATAAERQIAYKRVREELDGLIVLSDDAVEVLEKQVAPELEAGRPAATPKSRETPEDRATPEPPAQPERTPLRPPAPEA